MINAQRDQVSTSGVGRPGTPTRARHHRRIARRHPAALLAAALAGTLLLVGLSTSPTVGAQDDTTEVEPLAPAGLAVAPTVTATVPSVGTLPGGDTIALTGTGLSSVTAVNLVPTGANNGGGTLSVTRFVIVSDSRIVAKTPPAPAGGSYVVRVTNPDGTNTTGASFNYVTPTITAVSPTWAVPTVARTVTITGAGFSGAVAADVTFAGVAASEIYVVSDSSIVARTPTSGVSAGDGRVVVTRNGVATADVPADDFLFAVAPPSVSSLSAHSTAASGGVAIGGQLTITGANLNGVTSVFFGTTEVKNTPSANDNVTVESANSVRVKVPNRVTGPVDVVVQSAAGRSAINLNTGFDYLPAAVPTITTVQPTFLSAGGGSVAGGGVILINGSNFTGVTAAGVVAVCSTDVAATAVVVLSNTALIATFPGNNGVAESCGLRIVNAAGGSATKPEVINFV